MPIVPVESLVEGDVIRKNVVVGETILFGAGTVLAKKFIDILKMLKVKEVDIDSREGGKFRNLKELFQNIDSRFSCVEDKPFMKALKFLIKDIVANQRGYR